MMGGVTDRLKAIEPGLIALRRDIHRHPVTAFAEVRTSTIEAGGCRCVHTPLYDFDDAIIVTGAAYWLNVVQREPGRAGS
jgi:metal-dependent amidase/aminoacylase/carboxypeptidase family protein